VPHAAAQQVIAVGDKFILKWFVSMDNVGVYSMAVSFGLTQKLFLSAFESAWAPFYYATIKEPDAPRVFRTVTTYGIAVLVLLTAGLSAVGGDAVRAMTHGFLLAPDDPRWTIVSSVITWTAIGVLFQGVYLLTSIGLNITKRTQYYPVATMTAAAVNLGLNLLMIPRFGLLAAAWANGAAYAVQAGLGYVLSQRVYPIAYEWGRIARVCVAGLVASTTAQLLPSIVLSVDPRSLMAHAPNVVSRGIVVILVYGVVLGMSGFFRPDEIRRLKTVRRRGWPDPSRMKPADSTERAGEIVATDIETPEPDREGRG
jgi:O-antigen/teichoic acid export membrane protein